MGRENRFTTAFKHQAVRLAGTARTTDVTEDEVPGMIILGKCPPGIIPGPGALSEAA